MNELQIRLSADITALQSALTKAKNTIKSFESETEKESEKGNVGFKRKIGLIEQLTNKAKALRTALSQATNETQVAKYNAQLEETSRELTRLNALGRSVTANLGSTAGGFGQVARQGANANGVAIEFNRIIQDAPFGLIGIGNNLQQLAGNFAQVSKDAKGTGAAVKASLASIISPVNLGLLAISALTAGFTAYQMGAFDGILATEDVGKAAQDAAQKLEDYRNSLDAVTRASIEGANQGQKEAQAFQLLRAQAENANIPLSTRIQAVTDLQKKFPEYLGNLSKEQILTGNVGTAYEDLTNQIIATAKARAFSDQIAENSLKILTLEERAAQRSNDILKARNEFAKAQESVYDVGEIEIIKRINDLSQEQVDDVIEINRLRDEEVKLTSQINSQIDQGAKFTDTEVKAVKELNLAFDETLAKVQMINQFKIDASKVYDNITKALKVPGESQIVDVPIEVNLIPEGGNQELGLVEKLQKQIQSISALRDVATDPSRVQAYNEQLKALQNQLGVFTGANDTIRDSNRLVADSFGALGTAIAANLDISNDAVKGFVSTVLSNAPKLIQAIIAQAQASNRAADIANQGNIKQATGNAIVTATAGAKALGPVGLAALPILIGGALALISSAFGKGGGGGSGSVSSASAGAPPQIFTNSQIPFIPSNPAPSPSGNIDFDQGQGRLTTTVSGGDIVFVYEREKERQQGGG